MAISNRASGSWAFAASGSVTPTLPTHVAGDMLIVRVAYKSSAVATCTASTATSGWAKVGESGGSTNSGNGSGTVAVAAFWKEAASASETNPTITFSQAVTQVGHVALSYQKGAGEAWSTPVGFGGQDTSAGTVVGPLFGITAATVVTGDLVDFFIGIADDATFSVRADISDDGVSFGAVTRIPATAGSDTTGADGAYDGGYRTATAGSSSGAGTQITATVGATETGGGWVTRLRVAPIQTTLYLVDTASDYSTGTNDANLRGTAVGWNNKSLAATAGAGAVNAATSTATGPTAGLEVVLSGTHAWISPPLAAAVTISGPISWNVWASENNASANVAINGRLEVIDGATGTITLIHQTARTTEVALTTRAVNTFNETPSAGVNCKKGDRLRVRIFADDAGTMASSFTWSASWSGSSAGADGDTWVGLSEAVTFVSEPASSTVYLTDTASAVSTASVDREAWTSRGAGVQTDVRNSAAGWTAPLQVTDTAGGTVVDWFTKPLTAFTLGAAVRVNVRSSQNGANAGAMRCEIARVDGDGTNATAWGATSDIGTATTGTELVASFLVSADDLAISDGQRLRLRLLTDDRAVSAMAAGFAVTLYYAGTSGGASGDTYLTFTQTLTEFVTGTVATPTTAALVLTTFAPTISLPQTVTPTTATLAATAFAPTIALAVIPTTASLTLATFAPTVTATEHQLVTPTTLALALTTFAPTVTAPNPQLVTPTTAAIALTTFAPTVTTPVLATPTTVSLTLTTFAATVTTPVLVTATTAALTLTTFAPTVTATAGQLVTPTTVSLVLTAFAPTVTATTQTIASDDFSDTTADDWGTADIGGAWTESGTAADWDKASGVGTIVVAASGIKYGYLPSIAVQDSDATVMTKITTLPTGGAVFSYMTSRNQATTDLYFVQLEWRTTGGIRGGINRRIGGTGSGGTLVALDGVAFGNLTYTAGDWFWMRMQTEGVSPTTIRFKIWKDGTTEPSSWAQTTTDSTSPLQSTGAVGLGNNAASGLSNGPAVTSFESYNVVTIAVATTVTPTTLALTLTTFAPTVSTTAHQTATPTTAALALTLFAPTVALSDHKLATPTTIALALTTYAPTVTASNHQSVAPSTAALTLVTFAPTVSTPRLATPTTLALTLTTFAPTVTPTNHQTVTPTTKALTLAVFAPTVTATAHVTVTPTTASFVLAFQAPSVTVGDAKEVTPDTKALTLTTFAPTVTGAQNVTVTPTTKSLVLTTFAPIATATAAQLVTPTTATLTLTLLSPIVTATAGQTVVPTTKALTLTTFAPTVSATAHVTVTPTTKALVLTTFAPAAVIGYRVTPTTASLTVTLFAPTGAISDNRFVIPGTIPLVLTTFPPDAVGIAPTLPVPPTAHLVLTLLVPLVIIQPPFDQMHGVLVQDDFHGGVLVVTGPRHGATVTQTRGRTTLVVTTPRVDAEIESN